MNERIRELADKMNTYKICVETGPCGGDHYYVTQRAKSLDDAIKIVERKVKKLRPWQHIMISLSACYQINIPRS